MLSSSVNSVDTLKSASIILVPFTERVECKAKNSNTNDQIVHIVNSKAPKPLNSDASG